ncbi:phosphotransferase [Mycolicibacterium anyangense]|uniref:phosphotransferase n=1 Tax=Mycolicibacterium anyangense TaxID=1431246 RepID=UPI00248368FB|nr:phosphotransferase [Mycolicibacterium anyangense]
MSDGERQAVVRRPPRRPHRPGAHDVLREARLVIALARTSVPVPRVLATASAGEGLNVPVVGTEFVDAAVITERTPSDLARPAIRGWRSPSLMPLKRSRVPRGRHDLAARHCPPEEGENSSPPGVVLGARLVHDQIGTQPRGRARRDAGSGWN